jgi:hypothetical protein
MTNRRTENDEDFWDFEAPESSGTAGRPAGGNPPKPEFDD